MPARRDDSPGAQGARRADGRPAAPVRHRASSAFEPLDAARRSVRRCGCCRASRRSTRTDDGCDAAAAPRAPNPAAAMRADRRDDAARARRAGARAARGRVHPTGRRGAAGADESEQALRANLQGLGTEGSGGMKKIGLIARREFLATVANKGFIIGLLIMPALIALACVIGPRLIERQRRRRSRACRRRRPDRPRAPASCGDVCRRGDRGAACGENARRALAQAAPGRRPAVAAISTAAPGRLDSRPDDWSSVRRPPTSSARRTG